MQIKAFYSHLNGFEWLHYHRPGVWEEIREVIEAIDLESCRTKESKEKTMLHKRVLSPKEINRQFRERFVALGWRESRVSYYVTRDESLIRGTLMLPVEEQKKRIEECKLEAIFSYNQTDFVKDRVAIEVQLGKYAFVAYDVFVKHLAFFMRDQIDCGIEIVPMHEMQQEMSSGPPYYEGALYDIVRQGRGVPAVPLILIGIA